MADRGLKSDGISPHSSQYPPRPADAAAVARMPYLHVTCGDRGAMLRWPSGLHTPVANLSPVWVQTLDALISFVTSSGPDFTTFLLIGFCKAGKLVSLCATWACVVSWVFLCASASVMKQKKGANTSFVFDCMGYKSQRRMKQTYLTQRRRVCKESFIVWGFLKKNI